MTSDPQAIQKACELGAAAMDGPHGSGCGNNPYVGSFGDWGNVGAFREELFRKISFGCDTSHMIAEVSELRLWRFLLF